MFKHAYLDVFVCLLRCLSDKKDKFTNRFRQYPQKCVISSKYDIFAKLKKISLQSSQNQMQ